MGETSLDFNKAIDDRVAAASAWPYENHFRLAADRPCRCLITQIFLQTG